MLRITILCFFCLSCSGPKDSSTIETFRRSVCLLNIAFPEKDNSFVIQGVLKAMDERSVVSGTQGEVEKLWVTPGQTINTGDVIVTLASEQYKVSLEEMKENFTKTDNRFVQARIDYEHDKERFERGTLSKQKLEKSFAAFQSIRNQFESLQQAMEIADSRVDSCTLRADSSGIIMSVLVDEKQSVSQGQVVATFALKGNMVIDVDIPCRQSKIIDIGEGASVRFEEIHGVIFYAKVIKHLRQNSTEMCKIRLEIWKKDPRFYIGMKGRVFFKKNIHTGHSDNIVIPIDSVMYTPDMNHWVWNFISKKSDDLFGSVVRRRIEIGSLTPTGITVKKGLNYGDSIVVEGMSYLTEGMDVMVISNCE